MDRTIVMRIVAATGLATLSTFAAAQNYPSGGGGRNLGGGSIAPLRQEAPRRAEPTLRQDAVGLFAAALEKDIPSLGLSPGALAAVQGFVRDMKDFTALGDKLVQQRMGWTQPPVHATVDVSRDLDAVREATHEFDGAAADVASDWKKLVPLLDDTQRRKVEALYANALLDSRKQPGNRN